MMPDSWYEIVDEGRLEQGDLLRGYPVPIEVADDSGLDESDDEVVVYEALLDVVVLTRNSRLISTTTR